MIKPDCESKIRSMMANSTGQSFCDLFNAIANDASIERKPSATLVLPLYDDTSKLESGDWAPEIHFVIRKVE